MSDDGLARKSCNDDDDDGYVVHKRSKQFMMEEGFASRIGFIFYEDAVVFVLERG